MNWAVGVTTAPRDHCYLFDTLNSIADAGWPSPVVFAEPGTIELPGHETHRPLARLGSYRMFLWALARLCHDQPAADAYLILQDDILVARHLREWLEPQLWPGIGCGVLSLYTAESVTEGRGRGWFALERADLPRRAYGACAVAMPPDAAHAILKAPLGSGLTKTDYHLGVWCRDARRAWVQHVPSLVRHVGRVTAIPRGRTRRNPTWTAHRHEGEWVADAFEFDKENPQ